jgi:AAA+ ATPase superfamily predicted ATPase
MDKIIGRVEEQKRLERCVASKEAQLVAIYGRRRVGKTYLVKNYFAGRFDFMLTGINNATNDVQLKNFIMELNNQTGKDLDAPKTWLEAFALLRDYIESLSTEEKCVVFFDEMPWLDSAKSGFLTAFEWFWNGYGSSNDNLIFIVCGSATSWMMENIDNNQGGLYNRLTCRIYIKPFTLQETEEYLQSRDIQWSRYDIVQCYMIMGGIPYYLRLLDPELSYNRNIDNLFFRKRAELWDEYANLYSALFKNSGQYEKIVEALSKKKSGLTREEVVKETGLPNNGNLTRMLNDLEYSGFVRINNFFGAKKKVYQLADYYTLFYFKFIKENYGKDEHFWSNTIENASRRTWAGITFEQVCKDHVDQIKNKLGISGVLSELSTWSQTGTGNEKGAQIDMVIKRRDRVINICECKYCTNEYEIDKDYETALRNKVGVFVRAGNIKDSIQLTMITTYGVKRNKHSSVVNSEVTMDDLFAV